MASRRKKRRQKALHNPAAYREAVDGMLVDIVEWFKNLKNQWPELKRKFQNLPATNYELGNQYFDKGDFSNALIRYRIALWLAPQYPAAHFKLARCYQVFDNLTRAKNHYQMALKLNPKFTEAAFMLSILNKEKLNNTRLPINLVIEQFNRLAPFYRTHYIEAAGYTGHLATEKAVGDWAAQTIAQTGDRQMARFDVLELGCGCGVTGERMRAYARLLTGVDISAAMLNTIPTPPEGFLPLYDKLHHEDYHEYIKRQPGSIMDMVLAIGVANYVGDLQETIEHAARILRPKGMLVLTCETYTPAEGEDPKQPYDWRPERGSFAHQLAYVKGLARQYGLSEYRIDHIMLYRNVTGFLAMFTKPC